jgi:hypothetical protein
MQFKCLVSCKGDGKLCYRKSLVVQVSRSSAESSPQDAEQMSNMMTVRSRTRTPHPVYKEAFPLNHSERAINHSVLTYFLLTCDGKL